MSNIIWNEFIINIMSISFREVIYYSHKNGQTFIEEMVGFYNWKDTNDNIFEIGNICVKTEYQNKGIGTTVLKEIIFEYKEQNIKLQVFKTNERAVKLYKKMGFEKIEETEIHYIMKLKVYGYLLKT